MSAQQIRIAWIQGGAAKCEILPPLPPRLFRLVLLGAPGVGKGTQAELLCERLGTCHLSTGDIFRAAKCLAEGERSPALEAALGYMKRGDLVPDQTVLDLVRERISLPPLPRRVSARRISAHGRAGGGFRQNPGAGTNPARRRVELRFAH